jgi:hypothetical protein
MSTFGRTLPEQPNAPQLGKHEMFAQQNAQHKISLRSSTASLLLMVLLLLFFIFEGM